MTDRDKVESPPHPILLGVLFFVLVMGVVAFPVLLWGVYPHLLFAQYEEMSYVNTTGLVFTEFPYKISPGPSQLMGDILYFDDPTIYSYYNIRIVEGPDTGPVIPWGPKVAYNTTQYDLPLILKHYQLNPCVDTRLIIVTDRYYFVKEFRETMICG